jgi:hypothetical protein
VTGRPIKGPVGGVVSRPVAIARGLLVAAVTWGTGALVTVAVFSVLGASTTIADVSGQSHRVQIIWWAAHAFCACLGGLLGVAIGGSALTRDRLATPAAATLLVSSPVLLLGAVALVALTTTGVTSGDLALASAVGLLTGALGGAVYVLQSGPPEEAGAYYPAPRTAGRSWGSR